MLPLHRFPRARHLPVPRQSRQKWGWGLIPDPRELMPETGQLIHHQGQKLAVRVRVRANRCLIRIEMYPEMGAGWKVLHDRLHIRPPQTGADVVDGPAHAEQVHCERTACRLIIEDETVQRPYSPRSEAPVSAADSLFQCSKISVI